MTIDGVPGRVTICSSGRSGLFADDAGVIVRNWPRREQRFAWSQISHFADGSLNAESGGCWVLNVVLRNGQTYSVDCTRAASTAARKTLAAIRQVAERYEVPAQLAGVMMRDGRPACRGCLYKDPGGKAGVRYWDGKRWSPLLSSAKQSGWPVRASAATWADLPLAPEPWDYPAVKAARAKVWMWVCVVLTAVPVVAGVVVGLVSGDWVALGVWSALDFVPVVFLALPTWFNWLHWRALDELAKAPVGHLN